VSSDTGIIELAGLSGANLIAVEHADPVVALCAAVTVIDDNGLNQDANAGRAVLHRMAMRAIH
jgi:hypothetical protein